jgi:hypothetical protein
VIYATIKDMVILTGKMLHRISPFQSQPCEGFKPSQG